MQRKLVSWSTAPILLSALVAAGGLPGRAASVSLAIPTYFAPSDTADWNKVLNNGAKISIVVFNPASGPDPSQASSYQSLYNSLHAKGIKVLGYVHTLGGCRPYGHNYNYTSAGDVSLTLTNGNNGVEGNIKEWAAEQDVDGIFLDEGPGAGTWSGAVKPFTWNGTTWNPDPSLPECSGTSLNYYKPLRAYAQSLTWPNGGTPSITLNPGGPTDEQYLYDSTGANTQNGVADIVLTAEEYNFPVYAGNNNAWLAAQFAAGGSLNWVYNHTPNHFWQLCYGFDPTDIDPSNPAVNEVANSVAQAKAWNADYVYYTDSTTPWSTLAGTTVWNDELWNSAGQITPPAVPAAPTGLTATAGNARVALSWTASSGATSYNVYRGTAAGGESTTPIATGLTGTTYTDTGLANGTTYYYKVAAVNSAGTSSLSNEASATTVATIYNVSESLQSGNYTFSFSYLGSWTYFHVFMDTDQNASTGYTVGGIGADYMIENGTLYRSTANGSSWSWSSVGTVNYSNSGGVATFTVASSAIGSPAHMNVVYQVATSTTSYTTGVYSY